VVGIVRVSKLVGGEVRLLGRWATVVRSGAGSMGPGAQDGRRGRLGGRSPLGRSRDAWRPGTGPVPWGRSLCPYWGLWRLAGSAGSVTALLAGPWGPQDLAVGPSVWVRKHVGRRHYLLPVCLWLPFFFWGDSQVLAAGLARLSRVGVGRQEKLISLPSHDTAIHAGTHTRNLGVIFTCAPLPPLPAHPESIQSFHLSSLS
jgi:hypothetical protein